MGFALANALFEKGADVTIVSGPVHQTKKYNGIKIIQVSTAEEMYNACMNLHR